MVVLIKDKIIAFYDIIKNGFLIFFYQPQRKKKEK